jgi:GTP cyclohydrolase II
MNHLSPLFAPPEAHPADAAPSSAVNTSRQVRHAILDIRAGLPVLIVPADPTAPSLIALAAETATEAGLAALEHAATTKPLLILAATRAQAVTDTVQAHGVTALHVPPGPLTQAALLALADPTQPQPPHHAATAPSGPLAAPAIKLAKLARLLPAMLVAEAPATTPLTAVTAADILAYQAEAVSSLARVAEAAVPLAEAEHARLVAYRPADGGPEHLALLIGAPELSDAPLVRIHSECFTGDLLGSLRCDCGPQLHQAIQRMAAEGAGVLLYMAQEGRGIGLVNKLRAYALQDRGLDTLDANRALGWAADERDFAAAALMLRDLGITRVRLLTNNPDKVAALDAAGITVAGRLRHAIAANGVNDGYLETKARRFGHLLG